MTALRFPETSARPHQNGTGRAPANTPAHAASVAAPPADITAADGAWRARSAAPAAPERPADASLPPDIDVAVIGGGLAGLAAAATAARAGRRVVLFEQATTLGGRARTRTANGYTFNIGPHALYRGSTSLRVLRDLGVEPRAALVGLGGARALYQGRLYDLPAGLRTLLGSPLLSWRARFELLAFLGTLGRRDLRALDGLTLADFLEGALRTPIARQLVAAAVRTASYANDPERLSAGAGLRQLEAGSRGALYVHGGWQTIVDDLRARAQALGASVVAGARVAEVEPEGAAWAIRLADGRRYDVGAVVLAVPPGQASALVAGGQQPTLRAWAERAVPVRAACLDVALRRLPRPDTWFAVGLDRPLYLSVHSAWAQLAPEGGALVHVMRYLGNTPRGGPDDERELEHLLDLAQPGWRDEVVSRRFAPSLTVAGALPSVSWEQKDGPRGPAVPGMDGLFVAGDWVGPEGLLADRALASGARAGVLAAAVPACALGGR